MKIRENFIKIPYIPQNPVSLALIDGRYGTILMESLGKRKIKPILVGPCSDLYPSISSHPDIQCHPLGGNKVIIAPNANESLKNQLIQHDFDLIVGHTRLESNYPNNIAYNVARIGSVAFHNEKYTDPVLKEILQGQGVEFIHVNQGYSKCSVSIIDEYSMITSDRGIARIAEEIGLNVMVISPGYIRLPGLDYGFIGGATGLIGENDLGLIGNLESHVDKEKVEAFLKMRGKTPISLCKFPLVDIGSLIPLKEYN